MQEATPIICLIFLVCLRSFMEAQLSSVSLDLPRSFQSLTVANLNMAGQTSLLPSLLANSEQIPQKFIRPATERVCVEDVLRPSLRTDGNSCISVLNLSKLKGSQHAREAILLSLNHACRTDGFFQVVNHGVPKEVIEETVRVCKKFFSVPWTKEKAQLYSEDPQKSVRLSTSFNVNKEIVLNWREYLRLRCHPLDAYISLWPSQPPEFKSVVSDYCNHLRSLFHKLLDLITVSFQTDQKNQVHDLFSSGSDYDQHLAMNHYPRCPNPEMTLGLPPHTDPTLLTILLPDQVPGLHVLKSETQTWVEVAPVPDSFIVNVGDHLQAITNGVYRSGVHRVIVNSCQSRISIPSFFYPPVDAVVEPVQCFVTPDNPRKYRSFTCQEFWSVFWKSSLDSPPCLESFILNPEPDDVSK